MIPVGSHPAWHPVFESLAYVTGYAVYRKLRSHRGDVVDERQRWTVIAAAAVGALIGSRLLGRVQGFNAAEHRLTLTEVRRRILQQTNVFRAEDLIPVPCHPDALAMAYALKLGGKVVPLTGMVAPQVLIDGARNTIVYEQESGLREHLFKLFATNHSPQSQASTLRELLCCLPKVLIPGDLGYRNLFRVLIVQFIDAEAFDVRSVKKSCIHIAHPDGKRLIPFDTFNMFYRGELETTRLAALRGIPEADPSSALICS